MTTPDVLPRATDHIDAMAELIAQMLETGNAYRTEDGSIFFRISSWPAYGRLSRLDATQLRVGERVVADDYGKDDVRDFALWKGPKPGDPSWDTAVGPGRPGWHIECSAMSMRHLGASFDIHTGGIDLIFPHHEDEIAQSEAVTGQTFVRTWLHCDHLRLGGTKMARRIGNIARVADLLEAGVSPRALRYALISVHYRQALEYSDASIEAATAAVGRLDALLAALEAYREDRADAADLAAELAGARGRFEAALDDDLNISAALASLFDLVRELNRRIAGRSLSSADAERAAAFLRELDTVLGILPDAGDDLPAGAQELLEARVAARGARDFAASDRLRDELAALGISVEDTRDGQRWRRLEVVR
jgi:cysteinyl-tRNA synthetase